MTDCFCLPHTTHRPIIVREITSQNLHCPADQNYLWDVEEQDTMIEEGILESTYAAKNFLALNL